MSARPPSTRAQIISAIAAVLALAVLLASGAPLLVASYGLVLTACLVWFLVEFRRERIVRDAAPPQTEKLIIVHALFWLALHSAWARWQRAFQLAKNDQEIGESNLMHIATAALEEAARTGKIGLWGVPTGGIGFERISPELLQTRARLRLEPDDRQIWKVSLGAKPEILPLFGPYDSLAIDLAEVKQIWPERDPATDRETKRLEKEYARRAGR